MKEDKEKKSSDEENLDKAFNGWIDAGREIGKVEEHVGPELKSKKNYPSFYIQGLKKFGNFKPGEEINMECVVEVRSVRKEDPDKDGEMIYEVCFDLKKFKVEDEEIDIGEDKGDKEYREDEEEEDEEEDEE